MSKKILVLTASYKKNGNTAKMADAFIEGAKNSGHEIFRFDTAFHNLHDCIGCNKCWSKGKACVMEDDFNKLAEFFETCEVLLISTPLYWFGFPANVKAAIDKLYAYGGKGGLRPLSIKETYFFVCGGDPTKDEYKPIQEIYRNIVNFLGWKDRGIIQTGGHDETGAIEASGVLKQAEQMGRNV